VEQQTIGEVGNSIICLWVDNFCLNSKRIITTGQYLRKLCSNEKGSSFFDSQCRMRENLFRRSDFRPEPLCGSLWRSLASVAGGDGLATHLRTPSCSQLFRACSNPLRKHLTLLKNPGYATDKIHVHDMCRRALARKI